MGLTKVGGKKATTVIAASLVFATAALMLALYIENVHSVKIAQLMMQDAALLRINESSLRDVRAFAARYSGTTTGKWHSDPCVEADCLAVTQVPTKNFWQRHPRLSEWRNKVFRRSWSYSVFLWVEGGKLVAQQQWFFYVTPQRNVAVITQISQPSAKLCQNQSYRLHHAFATTVSPHHFNVWVDGKATRYRELVRLNLACVTTLSGCTGASDVVPTAWLHYQADQQLLISGDPAPDSPSDCQ